MVIQVGVTRLLIENEEGSLEHIWISKDYVDKLDVRIFNKLHNTFGQQAEYKISKRFLQLLT